MSNHRGFACAIAGSIILNTTIVHAETSSEANSTTGAHFRPLLLGSYLSFNAGPNGSGGMVVTAPFGVEWDAAASPLDGTRYLKWFTIGAYGPGVNWAAFGQHEKAWGEVLLGAIHLGVVQFAFQTEERTELRPRPSEFVLGPGLFSAVTGDILNSRASAWDTITVGAMLNASYTPANM
jgi:hypothetical protein